MVENYISFEAKVIPSEPVPVYLRTGDVDELDNAVSMN